LEDSYTECVLTVMYRTEIEFDSNKLKFGYRSHGTLNPIENSSKK
jgi:hypothetical protein